MRSRAAGLRLREAARLQLVLVRFEVINGKRDVVNSWQLEKAGLNRPGQPSQCRKKSVQSPKAALGRSRPRANPTCLRTLQVRWIPTSRSAKRNGGSSPLSWQSRRHVHGPTWLVRTGVLVWLRIRRARLVCSVRRSTADGTARKRQTRTRLIGRDTSQEPRAVAGERLAAMADKGIRRRVPMLSAHNRMRLARHMRTRL